MKNSELLTRFFAAENKRDWENFRSYLHPQVMWFIHTEDSHSAIAGREDFIDASITDASESGVTFTCERTDVSASGNRVVAHLLNSDDSRTVRIVDFEEGLIKWIHEFVVR